MSQSISQYRGRRFPFRLFTDTPTFIFTRIRPESQDSIHISYLLSYFFSCFALQYLFWPSRSSLCLLQRRMRNEQKIFFKMQGCSSLQSVVAHYHQSILLKCQGTLCQQSPVLIVNPIATVALGRCIMGGNLPCQIMLRSAMHLNECLLGLQNHLLATSIRPPMTNGKQNGQSSGGATSVWDQGCPMLRPANSRRTAAQRAPTARPISAGCATSRASRTTTFRPRWRRA
mmetsp:Transcript_64064/g.171567  ORF Transcript_64064/g.171567 Transcript_64064/m.171567 type:complete len:229 (+) Transcript_64064:290-976(+)